MAQEGDKKRGFAGIGDRVSRLVEEVSEEIAGQIAEEKKKLEEQASSATKAALPAHEPITGKSIPTPSSSPSNQAPLIVKIAFLVFGVMIVSLIILNNLNEPTRTSYSPPIKSPDYSSLPRSFDNWSTRSTLAQEIKYGKTRAKQLETQIKDMDDRLDDYERRMRLYRASGMMDEYNMLVPSFNSLVNERNSLYAEYKQLVGEVNSKVRRYNLGYR